MSPARAPMQTRRLSEKAIAARACDPISKSGSPSSLYLCGRTRAVLAWSCMDFPDASDSRLELLTRWVMQDLGFACSRLEPASADASFRRYFRVTRGEESFIVMDAPPEKETLGPLLHVA